MTASSAWTNGEQRRTLGGGGWTVEVIDASVDHIAYEGHEILRALRVIVRDHDWRTIPATIDELVVDVQSSDEVVVTLRGHHEGLGVGDEWSGRLRLLAGRLTFDFSLEAASEFRRNRIGVVILHPARLAGRPFTLVHPDGSRTESTYPVDIAPHQPARDIAGLRWDDGCHRIDLSLDGDVFEMEDQRNWTDSSFKTYSTPLSLPFPVLVHPGDRVAQSVELRVSSVSAASTGSPPSHPSPETGDVPSTVGLVATSRVVPETAVGASTAPGPAPASLPWMVGVDVLVELDLRDPGWEHALARASAEADQARLDVRLIADRADQLDEAVIALRGVVPRRVGVFDAATHVTTELLWIRLVDLARQEHLDASLVGGTRAHFTELNRSQASLPGGLGGVTFSLTPQMHDTSTDQVVESLDIQRLVARQATRIAAGRPVHIGPVTLRARFNAVATSAAHFPASVVIETGYGAEFVWGSTDPRQSSEEFAAWLLASAVALSVEGVESLAFAESWGPRGFGDVDGTAFPAATVLGWLAEIAGMPVVEIESPPRGVAVLAARRPDGVAVVLLANVSSQPQPISVLARALVLPPLRVERLEIVT
ncbi:MAG: hypothetical protein JWP75_922 [Frondihabitans sp.]|nr:hypothetical protein [Frondihabitans sp.]